jgi:AcrR family transcriptional regulator
MSAQPVEQPVEKRSRYDVESLLAVAVEVFGKRGYDGTSMDDLARAAGITKSSFYHHVKGKEELLRRSLDRALGGLFAALEAAEAGSGPAVERLEGLLRGSVAVLISELPHVTLLLRVRGNTETERSALARRREFEHRVTALVAAAEAEGDLRRGADPALTARLLFGLINSLTEWYRPGGELGDRELADAVVELALGGLRVRPS